VQFAAGAILQHSATPTSLFEHEDEHEDDFDAPGEGLDNLSPLTSHLSPLTDYPPILTSAAAIQRADLVRSLQEALLWSQEQSEDKTKHQLRTTGHKV
jgi:hypothetical protein